MGLELSTVFVWHTLERWTKEEKGIYDLRGMKKLGIAQEERDQQRKTSKLDKCNSESLQQLNLNIKKLGQINFFLSVKLYKCSYKLKLICLFIKWWSIVQL